MIAVSVFPVRLLAALTVASAAAAAVPVDAQGEPFESADRVPAARFLAPEQMSGTDWRVAAEASSDGFANTYSVESRFGTWPTRGAMMVAFRIREIEALAELDRISRSSVFLDAVKRSAVGQVETVASFAAQPVETVKAIPGGMKRWFQKTTYHASEAYHDVKEEVAEESSEGGSADDADRADKTKEVARREALDYLKISTAERRWYAELGVDPYTDNEILRRAIKSYARIEGLTSFGMRFVGLPSIPGVGMIRKTMDLVWTTDPWELRRRNRKLLLEAGIGEEMARAFEDNPAFSLTMQTSFVDSLVAFAGVAGRDLLLARSLEAETREDARLLVQASALLLRLHGEHEPLASFEPGARLPVARTRSGGLVAAAPADAFFWTAEMAAAATSFAALYPGEATRGRQLWLVGEASPRFREEAAQLGWEVRDRWRLATGGEAKSSASSRR